MKRIWYDFSQHVNKGLKNSDISLVRAIGKGCYLYIAGGKCDRNRLPERQFNNMWQTLIIRRKISIFLIWKNRRVHTHVMLLRALFSFPPIVFKHYVNSEKFGRPKDSYFLKKAAYFSLSCLVDFLGRSFLNGSFEAGFTAHPM